MDHSKSESFRFESNSLSLESIRSVYSENFERNPRSLVFDLVYEIGQISDLFRNHPDRESSLGLTEWSDSNRKILTNHLDRSLIALIRLADTTGIDLAESTIKKMAKNALKYPIDKAYGVSTKYNQL